MRQYLPNFVTYSATLFTIKRRILLIYTTTYIHEKDNWTAFRWDAAQLTALLETVSHKQGLLYGRLASLGFANKLRAMAENLTYDVVHTSEIEGIRLNVDEGMTMGPVILPPYTKFILRFAKGYCH